MATALDQLAAYLGDRLGVKLQGFELELGELTLTVARDDIPEVVLRSCATIHAAASAASSIFAAWTIPSARSVSRSSIIS